MSELYGTPPHDGCTINFNVEGHGKTVEAILDHMQEEHKLPEGWSLECVHREYMGSCNVVFNIDCSDLPKSADVKHMRKALDTLSASCKQVYEVMDRGDAT